MIRIRAFNIDQWAGTLDARAAMPALLRRLVHATAPHSSRIDFSAWESTQRPGWDGIVITREGNALVPAGTSAWEIGANTNIRRKADEDFDKRTTDPNGVLQVETTYVSVTPRNWQGKVAWCDEKKALGKWKDVRAYDSDDLEQWLEIAPAVAVWFGRMLGQRPAGVEDIERHWEATSALTDPPLLPEVFVASRNDQEQKVIEWLDGTCGVLAIECRAPTEVIDFVAAVLMRAEPARRELYLSRSVIVELREAFDMLRDSPTPLVLLVEPRLALEPELLSSAIQNGHHVLVAATRIAQEKVTALSLPRAYRYDLARALEQSDFSVVDSERASRAAGGSLAILKRRLARGPATNRPSWANPSTASTSTPFLWIGGWNSNSDADRQAVARLTGRGNTDNERAAKALAECEEPLLVHVLGNWALLSKDDAWMLLGPHASEHEFRLFEERAAEVLGEDDPQFDMPSDQRFYADIRGQVRRHSSLLRKNIAETIALVASLHETIGLPATWSVPARLDALVCRLLPRGCSWRRWASLEGNLPLLAEASPDAFLEAVESDLASPQPELVKLFTEDSDPLFGGCHHAGLLWALETLAWTPSHLTRVCRILLDLSERDPGGRWANRPARSAAEILSAWYPQTVATAEQRIRVLDAMLSYRPRATWELLHSLLPQHMGHATPTHRPYWRDWATTWKPGATHADYWLQVNACAQRVIDQAGNDVNRWLKLLDEVERIPAALHRRLLDSLSTLATVSLTAEDQRKIADVIREKVFRSRKYADADWSLPCEVTDSLEHIRGLFAPRDPVLKHQWLFAEWPEHSQDERLSFGESQARLLESRRDALGDVLGAGGLLDVQRLATVSESPSAVGATLADLRGDEFLNQIAPDLLVSGDGKLQRFAAGFIWQRFRAEGWPWVDRLPIREWPAEASARFLSCLPFEREAWSRATRVPLFLTLMIGGKSPA